MSEDYQLKRNVCNSLLLNFDKVLKIRGDREFTIPSHDVCERIFMRAFRELYGEDLHTVMVYYLFRLEESRKLDSKLTDAIYSSFSGDRDSMNFFDMHLSSVGENFDSEFFIGVGNYYRYYPKSREKAIKDINSFFNESELKGLNNVGNLIKKQRDIWWEEKLKGV